MDEIVTKTNNRLVVNELVYVHINDWFEGLITGGNHGLDDYPYYLVLWYPGSTGANLSRIK